MRLPFLSRAGNARRPRCISGRTADSRMRRGGHWLMSDPVAFCRFVSLLCPIVSLFVVSMSAHTTFRRRKCRRNVSQNSQLETRKSLLDKCLRRSNTRVSSIIERFSLRGTLEFRVPPVVPVVANKIGPKSRENLHNRPSGPQIGEKGPSSFSFSPPGWQIPDGFALLQSTTSCGCVVGGRGGVGGRGRRFTLREGELWVIIAVVSEVS